MKCLADGPKHRKHILMMAEFLIPFMLNKG
jgi:hypothetical protein